MPRFSFPRKLGEHIETLGSSDRSGELQFIEMVCWLIRHNLLILLRTYTFLLLPGYAKTSRASLTPDRVSSPVHAPGTPREEAYTLSPIPLTPEEEAYLDENFNDGSPVFQSFKKYASPFTSELIISQVMPVLQRIPSLRRNNVERKHKTRRLERNCREVFRSVSDCQPITLRRISETLSVRCGTA